MDLAVSQAATVGPAEADEVPVTSDEPVRSGFRHRRAIAALGIVVTVAAAWAWHRAHNARIPLLSTSVGITADGRRVALMEADSYSFLPGTRVLADSGPGATDRARRQAEWVGAAETHLGPIGHQALVRSSILDLNTLTLDNGASLAGWPQLWRYVWPRDAAFVAVALSHMGHRADALRVLQFLQDLQPASGVFQARYLPDGSGRVPDGRGEQTDGAGWALWAAHEVLDDGPGGAAGRPDTRRLKPLITRSVEALMRATASPDRLPPPSPDYWEVRTNRLSLGTAAPIALGLARGSELLRLLGDPRASDVGRRSDDVQAAVTKTFGPNYPRYAGDEEGSDAALSFLLPPFARCTEPRVRDAWVAAADSMKRPAGGVAPGATWKSDGISWTPETALFALTAASVGDGARAEAWLSWLDGHRTPAGSLPEKVLSNGKPAGPAPLAWSSATTVLAVQAMSTDPAPAC